MSTSPTSPTSSGTKPTASEAAATEATRLVRRYFAVLDAVRQRPALRLEELSQVATSTQLTAEQDLVRGERQQGLRQIGSTRIITTKIQAIDLDDTKPAAKRVPTVAVDICWDVTHADLVDKRGHSVVNSHRAGTGWTRYTVANYHWSDNPSHGWRVASSQNLKETPCAAS